MAKADYIKDELTTNQNDTKKFWQQISAILPKGKGPDLIKLIDGNSNTPIHDSAVPNFINDYFSTIGSKLAENLSTKWDYAGDRCATEIVNIVANEDELSRLFQNINTNKSSAIEYISSRLVKDVFIANVRLMLKIYNTSLYTGSVPTSWESATIIPLKKEGNSPDVNNLRPISLLPILEKIVHSRLMCHLDENNLLDEKQGGFRHNHSTTDTIIKFIILIKRLEQLGVIRILLQWIQNYLSDRTQCVFANNIVSSMARITNGVPQGSVLGPLLFLVYINDLGSVLNYSKHLLYADDTVIYCSDNNQNTIENQLQYDLDRFGTWCKGNKLTINSKKSNFVTFGTKCRITKIHNLTISLNEEKLAKVPTYKYLGVYLDSTLNFNKHIDNNRKIFSHKLYLLSRICRYINEYTAICIYKTMIAPIMDYGDIIYAGTNVENLDKLQRLQNRGLRICTNENHFIPVILLHQRCMVPNLLTRRTCNLRKYMYKQQNNVNIVVNRNIRTRRHDAVVYETCIPILEKYKKGAIYMRIQEWNNLPVDTRNIDTYAHFKNTKNKWMYNVLHLE